MSGRTRRWIATAVLGGACLGRPAQACTAFLLERGGQRVVRSGGSQWNIVYDPARLRVHFRTRVSNRIKSIDLGKLARDCAGPVQMLDIDADPGGDATGRLVPYSVESNSRLVERSLRPMAKQVPAGAAQLVSRYPSTLTCAAGR